MSWEARGTFRPRVRFTCNRFPSCGWQGEEEEEEQRKKQEEEKKDRRNGREGPQDKINRRSETAKPCPLPHQPRRPLFSVCDESSRRKPKMYIKLQNDIEESNIKEAETTRMAEHVCVCTVSRQAKSGHSELGSWSPRVKDWTMCDTTPGKC